MPPHTVPLGRGTGKQPFARKNKIPNCDCFVPLLRSSCNSKIRLDLDSLIETSRVKNKPPSEMFLKKKEREKSEHAVHFYSNFEKA
jgi:hypothetical protein